MIENKCRVCKVGLNDDNWSPAHRKLNNCICNGCSVERVRLWRKANPEKQKAQATRHNRKQGKQPFNENKECAQFLGIHIAERVLSHVFKNVERMPMHNPGYDVICNHNKKIDIKSSCQRTTGRWAFHINRNTTADYFLCIAFDNREDLNPLYAWLLPGDKFNHLIGVEIHQSTIHKWDEYKLDISKIITYCDTLKAG